MNIKLTLASAVTGFTLCATGPAMAQFDLLDGWSGSAGLGVLFTSGNSENTNVNGSASVTKQVNLWSHTAFGSAFYAEANDVDTAERFELGYKLDRQFTDTLQGFGRFRYDTDEFGNIDNRYSLIGGVGKKFLDDGKQFFSGEVGIGYTLSEFDIPLDADPLDVTTPQVCPDGLPVVVFDDDDLDDDGVVLYGSLTYSNKLSDILTFNSVFSIEIADVNTLTVWDNSLLVALSERISLSFGLLTRNNSDIEGALGDNTDTATRLNLVVGLQLYNFY